MVFPTFFNLSLNLAIRSSWSEPQSAPSLVFVNYIGLLHLWLQRILSIWFQYWPSGDVHVFFSYVVGRGYLLWPVRSLGNTWLAFALLHFVLQCQTCLLLQVALDFLLLHSSIIYGVTKSRTQLSNFHFHLTFPVVESSHYSLFSHFPT